MSFVSIFKDSNDYNEKTIIAFLSFVVATLLALISQIFATPLPTEAFFGFLGLTTVALGIEGGIRIFKR